MSFLFRCVDLLLAGLCGSAWAGGNVWVQTVVATPTDIGIPEAVLTQCGKIGEPLGQKVLGALAKRGIQASPLEGATPVEGEHVLKLELLGVTAPQGGGWTGGKSVTARVAVMSGDKVVASRVVADNARGMGGFSGTCSLVESAVAGAANKIGDWYALAAKRGFSAWSATGGMPFAMLTPATFESPDKVPPAVLAECGVDAMLANRVLSRLTAPHPELVYLNAESDVSEHRAVKLTIREVIAPIGGSASGPKSMRVRVDLLEAGREVASQEFEESAGHGGIFGAVFASACKILDSVSDRIAKRAVAWTLQEERRQASAKTNSAARAE